MRHVITRARALCYVIVAILVVVAVCIFPLRLFHEEISTSGKEHPAGVIEIGGEQTVLQKFTAEYDHINAIGVYIRGEHSADSLTLRVFKEANAQLLREVTVKTDSFYSVDGQTYVAGMDEGYADVYINLDTEVGEGYFYTLEASDSSMELPFEVTGNSGALNNGYMQCGEEVKDGCNLITRYTYEQPLRKGRSLVYIAVILALIAAVVLIFNLLPKKAERLNELCTVRWSIRLIFNPLIVIGAVVALIYIVPLHTFSIYIADIVVMALGVLILAAFLLYMLNIGWSDVGEDPFRITPDRVRNLAQSVCIALALWACVNYMNALYEIFHDIAWRKMAFFLGLGLIVTFKGKELVNIFNAVALVAGLIWARLYYTRNLADMVDEYHVDAMMWTCRLMPVILILAVFIVRSIVMCILEKKNPLKIVSIPYTVMSLAMGIAMVATRRGKYWPVLMLVIALVYGARLLVWDRREDFIGNVCNGVLLHFAGCIVFCLMHRPYPFAIYVRYPLVFHTATVTGEYMSLVMAAGIVRLFSKYRTRKSIRDCIPEMGMMGVISTYMLFTMSRTAFLAVVAMGLVMWIAYSFKDKTGMRLGSLFATAAMTAVCTVLAIFPVFTAQKAIPALVGEPRIMEVETYSQDVLISSDYDSEEFITFTRLAKAFCHKMIGMDEDKIKWDVYTIYGKKDNAYLRPMDIVNKTGSDSRKEPDEVFENGILLSADARLYSYDESGNFVPPWEFEGEGCPDQWWDEDYWTVDPETGGWIFAYWKVQEDENRDVTNGRTDIFKAYYEQLTYEGHDNMGAILPNGEESAHAHNIYLQVAYDHGIIVGIMFIIWCIFTGIQALIVFIRHRDADLLSGTVLAVSVTYVVCGVTEWISHPCNPVGLIMLLLVAPMALYRYGHSTDETVKF